ncbi:efflux RND transporter periplasmic adaptor subunit [Kordiimonas gwangyangensis]|uniref:efflux RND transporter periplasmic adaptor subunit n=1 Tax=Kordiimonas gwangyangensis TaxID=288022 RepID=UPI00036292A7|nr:efflux RND transporter periplasmic adaptor subunit [Kordiimonas gwangyangensis]
MALTLSFQTTKAAGAAFFLALTALTPASAQDMSQMPPAQVEVAIAETRMMAPEMLVSGTVISLNDSRIASEVEGPLSWIAQVGTAVKEGDVIARIDDRLLKVAARRAEANLKRLQANLTFREQDVKRYQELAKSDNTSQAKLQEVTAQRDMLVQEIADAQVTYERAQGDLARAEIRAPFPGHVVQRLANKGEYINVADQIVRLVDNEHIEVVIPAPITITPFLKVGEMVAVHDGRTSRMLPIRTVVPVGDMVSRMVEVRLTSEPDFWMVGTPVKVSLPKEEAQQAVAVPRDALVMKGDARFVYKVSADNTAIQLPADIASSIGLWVSLKSGLEEGDKVVVRGAERLMPGQNVMIQDASSR